MSGPGHMYCWRRMTPEQRMSALRDRQEGHKPWHSPPHFESDSTTYYMITAACYEHRPIIGRSQDRMQSFERNLVEVLTEGSITLFAWTVLPNHYHAIVETRPVKALLKELGRLHGRSSYDWNGEEGKRGRQVWHNAAETFMKSEGHYFASLNYVLNNAVHHGYVKQWTEWPYCNASEYLEEVGRKRATEIWKMYPIDDYGKDWHPPEL